MVQTIDLRVHAGAPTSLQDDERYRVLAQAYKTFRGVVLNAAMDYPHGKAETPVHVLLPPLSPRAPEAQALNNNVTMYAAEDTTFIDDTQLAFQTLESQLQTSSIAIPEVTPQKPTSSNVEASPWPEQLPHGSFEVAATSADDGTAFSELATARVAEISPEMRRSGKRRRLQAPEAKAPTFKPFKLPAKRTASSAKTLSTPSQAMHGRNRQADVSSHRSSPSQSSYLKTPILIMPQRAMGYSEKPNTEPHAPSGQRPSIYSLQRAGLTSHALHDQGEEPGLHFPRGYMALPEGSADCLADIGPRNPIAASSFQDPVQVSPQTDSLAGATSQLPTTYSLSNETSRSSKSRGKLSQRSSSDPGPCVSPEVLIERTFTQRSSSLPPQTYTSSEDLTHRPRHYDTAQAEINELVTGTARPKQRPVSAFHDFNMEQSHAQRVISATPAQALIPAVGQKEPSSPSVRALPLAIRPPEPVVSTEGFSTHITESLRYLAEESVVAKVFNPVSETRQLRLLERGHWLIRSPAWPCAVQIQFWKFLEHMIGSGKAGWGVWCVREPQRTPSVDAHLDEALGDVEIFCWGEVAKHIYLMLYAASQSKVRKCGLQWIDAEGEVVIQMQGR